MALLLYKSNEMFSSTELIRKSKMIFDKIVNDEIEKAIILRDGKPGFLLMDFYKYEQIMAEYEELKQYVEDNKKQKKPKKLKSEKKAEKKTYVPEQIEKDEPNVVLEELEIKSVKDTPKKEIIQTKVEEKIEPVDIEKIIKSQKKQDDQLTQETKIEDEPQNEIQEEQTVEEEIQTALESIKNMNFDDDMKKKAEDKIKAKIIKARQEREQLLKEQEEHEKEELKEELELQVQIKNEAKKKEQELKEFWD